VDNALLSKLLLGLGEAQMRAGDTGAGRSSLARAAELARETGLKDVLATAALNVGAFNLSSGAVDDLLVGLLEEALEDAEGATRARLLARLGTALYWSPQVVRRNQLAAEAERLARSVDDPATLAFVLGQNHVTTGWAPESAGRAVAEATEVIALAERAGEEEMALKARSWRINHYLTVGEVEPAFQDIDRFGELARQLRQPRCLWYAPLFDAMRAMMQGRFDDAERLGAQSLRIGQEVDESLARLLGGAQLFFLRWFQGRLKELGPAVEQFVELYPAMPAWRCALAMTRRELEDEVGTREVVAAFARDDFKSIPRDNIWLLAMMMVADACAWIGDAPAAAKLERLLTPYAELITVSPDAACCGPIERPLGLLAAAQGRHTDAAVLFERALERCLALGAPPLVAMTQIESAELLAGNGDLEGGARHAREALVIAQGIGMERIEERALRVVRQHVGVEPPSASG
jgi:tetratricopeptide (TPR) repeat protein